MKSFPVLVEIYKAYLQNNQQNASAHFEFAEIMEAIENMDVSAVHYREAGVIFFNKKEYKEAEKYLSAALRVQPKQCDIFYWKGKIQVARNNLREAVPVFRQCIDCKGYEENKATPACATELYTLINIHHNILTHAEYKELVAILNEIVERFKK